MKICLIQPRYSFDPAELERCEEDLISLLDRCEAGLDVIVLPEYSDVLADVPGKDGFYSASEKYSGVILGKAKETAIRTGATVFVNVGHKSDGGIRNTTHVIDRNGNTVGRYFKAHPAPSEVKGDAEGGHGLDVEYSYEFREPYILELDGVRYGFMTCYDFYFYEAFARLARERVDVIIGCSLQRTDTHEALRIINSHLAYNTNAYLVRASVSLGEDSPLCGTSSVVTPEGRIIADMESRVGLCTVEIDPKKKYYKPAGYQGTPKSHYEYIEEGRRPWLYRNAGPSVVPSDKFMAYPRLCAHRGFSTVAPENSMPALGAAVALGAEEIEFDLWATKDGVLVSAHDARLERVSDGCGFISEHTYAELLKYDFGVKFGESFRGLRMPTFEEILAKFAARVVMNIHVKIWDVRSDDPMLEKIVMAVRRYDAAGHVYFMTTNDDMIRAVKEYAPDIGVCVGWDGNKEPLSIVKRAIELGAQKVQLYKPYFNEETVRLAKEHKVITNVFFADDPDEARRYFEMGIDTVLTNDYLKIRGAAENLLSQKKRK